MGAGQFSGNPRAEWLADAGPDRQMRPLEPSRSRPVDYAIAEHIPDAARVPGEHSPLDLEERALYTLLAGDPRAARDDIDTVRATVERRLGDAPQL